MPHCPHCSEKCKTETQLLQHMNHPSSKCIQFFDELIWISEVLQQNWSVARWQVVSYHMESAHSKDGEMDGPDPSMTHLWAPKTMIKAALPFPGTSHSTYQSNYCLILSSRIITLRFTWVLLRLMVEGWHSWMGLMETSMPWCKTRIYIILGHLGQSGNLLQLSLSMAAINQFLSLDLVSLSTFLLVYDCVWSFQQIKSLKLSFWTAQDLCSWAEMLPAGPLWKCTPRKTIYPTNNPINLFYRDAIECVQSLMDNPLLKNAL